MKTCSKCNIQFDDSKKFCTKCGIPLVSEQDMDADTVNGNEPINVSQPTVDDIRKDKKSSNSKMIITIIAVAVLLFTVAVIILYKQIHTKNLPVVSKTSEQATVASTKTATPDSGSALLDPTTGMELIFVKGGCYPDGGYLW